MSAKRSKKLFEKLSFDWSDDSIRLFVTPTRLARALPYYIQEVGDFKTFYPYYTERMNLNSFQFIYTLSGKGELHYYGKVFTVRPRQLFLINCTERHVYFTPQGEIWNFLWVHYYGPGMKAYYREIVRDGFQVVDVEKDFKVESSLRRILALNQKKPLGYEILSANLIDTLLTEYFIQCLAVRRPRLTLSKDVERVINDIEAHFQEKLSLDLLARRHNISKYYLSRQFKAMTRTTINEYLINTRLNFGKERLRNTDDTVSKIAGDSGIGNVTHFINLFKAREGVTPLVYRRLWLSRTQDNNRDG